MLLVLIRPNASRAFFASSSDTDTVILLLLTVALLPLIGAGRDDRGVTLSSSVSVECFLCVEISALSCASVIVVVGGAEEGEGRGSPSPSRFFSSFSMIAEK